MDQLGMAYTIHCATQRLKNATAHGVYTAHRIESGLDHAVTSAQQHALQTNYMSAARYESQPMPAASNLFECKYILEQAPDVRAYYPCHRLPLRCYRQTQACQMSAVHWAAG